MSSSVIRLESDRRRQIGQQRVFVGDQTRDDANLHHFRLGCQRQSAAIVNISPGRGISVQDQAVSVFQLRQDRLPVPRNLPETVLII